MGVEAGDAAVGVEAGDAAVGVEAGDAAVTEVHDLFDDGSSGRRVVRGGGARIAAYAVGSLLSVASTAVVARELGATRFDGFATVLSLSLVALLVTDFGMATLGVREYVALRGQERDRAMAALLSLRLLLMVVGAAGMVGFSLLAGFPCELVLGALLAGLGLVVQIVPATFVVPLSARLRLGLVGVIELVRQAVQAVLLVVLALAGAGVGALLATSIPAGLAAAAVAVPAARGLAPPLSRPHWRVMAGLLRAAVSFAVATSIGATYAYVGQVVAHLSTAGAENGYYSLAFRVFVVLVTVAMLGVGGGYPLLVHAATTDLRRFDHAGSRLYEGALLLGLLIATALVVGAPAVVALLGGPGFSPATGMLRLLALALVGSFLVSTGSFLLLALRRHRTLLALNLSGLVLVVTATAVLGPVLGGDGAAIALCVTEYTLAAGYAVVLARAGRATRPAPRLLASCAVGVGAATAVLLLLALLTDQLGGPVVTGVVGGLLCPLALLLGALATGGVPTELTAAVRDRLRRRWRPPAPGRGQPPQPG